MTSLKSVTINKYIAILLLTISILSFGTPLFADLSQAKKANRISDDATAVVELTKLAEQGDAEAQVLLGVRYAFGIGVNKDKRTAVEWYKKSADQGYVEAQAILAGYYQSGTVVAQDYMTAIKLFTIAAETGDTTSQWELGWMYERGLGVKDNVRAHMWYNIAASLGDKVSRESRASIEMKMTRAEINMAQDLARECIANNYKGC
jgi:hypothetical protein